MAKPVPTSQFQPFSISVVPRRDEVAVVPTGEVDITCADRVEQEVRDLHASGFETIVVDLRGVTFLDSSGLRVLLALRDDALRAGRRLELVRGSRAVQRIFELTMTGGLFEWRDR